MSLLLETCLGDIVIDLDIQGSPLLCKNILKLAKSRYYTGTLVHTVVEGRYCQLGDPRGDGLGGCSIFGLIDSVKSKIDDVRMCPKRFIKSVGRKLTQDEMKEKGRVVAVEMGGLKDTIGSQFIITVDSGEERALDGTGREYFSIGRVMEDDDDVLGQLNTLYCDKSGRPYADVRIIRAHILDDPYEDPPEFQLVLNQRNIVLMDENDLPENFSECARWLSSSSPLLEKPKEEIVEIRISAVDAKADVDPETEKKRAAELAKKEEMSNAVMLEMLGDLPSADMKPPENVLFVCKLNPLTNDDDLTLIFSRFDPNAKAEVIRDQETGDSLQYAFVEFDTEAACNEAYFKMNNALIDDRRIKVDFSQSVSKEWNRYTQRKRAGNQFHDPKRSHSTSVKSKSYQRHSDGLYAKRSGYSRSGYSSEIQRNKVQQVYDNQSACNASSSDRAYQRSSSRPTNERNKHGDHDWSRSRRSREREHYVESSRSRRGRSSSSDDSRRRRNDDRKRRKSRHRSRSPSLYHRSSSSSRNHSISRKQREEILSHHRSKSSELKKSSSHHRNDHRSRSKRDSAKRG
jgi:peptidyl-prolyl cis-trans isomerase-like 4